MSVLYNVILNLIHLTMLHINIKKNYISLQKEKGYFNPAMVTSVAPVNGCDGYFP